MVLTCVAALLAFEPLSGEHGARVGGSDDCTLTGENCHGNCNECCGGAGGKCKKHDVITGKCTKKVCVETCKAGGVECGKDDGFDANSGGCGKCCSGHGMTVKYSSPIDGIGIDQRVCSYPDGCIPTGELCYHQSTAINAVASSKDDNGLGCDKCCAKDGGRCVKEKVELDEDFNEGVGGALEEKTCTKTVCKDPTACIPEGDMCLDDQCRKCCTRNSDNIGSGVCVEKNAVGVCTKQQCAAS